MSYKTFFVNSNNTDFFEKILVTKSVYPKYLTRSSIKTLEGQNSLYIDTDDLSFLSLKKVYKKGSSFYAKKMIFFHKLNKNLRFSSFFCFNKIKPSYTIPFLSALTRFITKPISRRFLFLVLVRPVKGGFIGFCNNFFGFVPRSQLILMSKTFIKKKIFSRRIQSKLIFLDTAKSLTKFISYRLRIRATNVTIISYTIRSAFSGRSRYHFLRHSNKINFVFVYKKQKNIKKKSLLNNQKSKNIKRPYVKKYIQHKKMQKKTKLSLISS